MERLRARIQNRRRGAAPLVLVVDDLRDQRELYAKYLRFCGYRVSLAANGLTALSMAARLQPRIIIMDLSMPDLDGFEATKLLKADYRTRHIPVVALTAYGTDLPRKWAFDAGCAAYLAKPCLPQELEQVVQRLAVDRRVH